MFVDAALAARIEAAEAAMERALAGAGAVQAMVDPLAEGHAILTRVGAPTNKIIGVGFGAPLDGEALAVIEARWWARGEAVRFEVSTLADPAWFRALSARGYQLDGFENVLVRRVEAPAAIDPAIAIERVTEASAADWRAVALDGFATPDGSDHADPISREAMTAMFDDLARSNPPRYLARIDGAPAGMATAITVGSVMLLCGAATAPGFRRRGVQRALLAARLADAHAAGTELAVVTTAPGSQSQANVMRLGFAVAYPRAVLIRAAP